MWYRVIRGGKFLGVPPWELAEAPLFWLQAAEAAQGAEHAAEQARAKRSSGRGGR